MIADIEFDIVAHLGYVRNIDMNEKGLYVLQLSLLCGEGGKKIAPVGLFSAPSCLDSYVENQKVPSVYLDSVCEMDDQQRKFRSRSFVIRYKNEKHELNEGVQWRLTVPHADLSLCGGRSPLCPELLQMRFDLMFCPLLEDKEGKVDLFKHADRLVPPAPVYTLVATQNLVLQRAGTGLHEYFPVRFNSAHYLDLDVMTHCAVTAIRYHKISLSVIPAVRRKATPSDSTGAAEDGTISVDNVSLEIDSSPESAQSAFGDESSHRLAKEIMHTPPKRSLQVAATATPYSTVVSQHSSADDLSVQGSEGSSAVNSNKSRLGSMSLSALKRLSGMMPQEQLAQQMATNPVGAAAALNNDSAIRKLYAGVAAAVKQPSNTSDDSSVATNSQKSLSTLDSASARLEVSSGSLKSGSDGEVSTDVKTCCGLWQSELQHLLAAYSSSLATNFDLFVADSQHLLDVRSDAHWNLEDLSGYLEREEPVEEPNEPPAKGRSEFGAAGTDILMQRLVRANSVAEVVDVLQGNANACNTQLSLRWSALLGALKRAMPGVQAVLKAAFREKMRGFWRSQLLVHTKSIAETHLLLPHEEMTLLSLAGERYRAEAEEVAARLADSKTVTQDSDSVLARGLRVFDAEFHAIPFLVLQQYIGGIHHDNYAHNPAPSAAPSNGSPTKGASAKPDVLIAGGAFDSSVRKGSVFLAFGGELLHCVNSPSQAVNSSKEIGAQLNRNEQVVDVARYLSLVPLFSTSEEGLACLHASREKFHSELLAKLAIKAQFATSTSTADPDSRSKSRLMSTLQGDREKDTAAHGGINISDRSRFSLKGLVTSKHNHSAAFEGVSGRSGGSHSPEGPESSKPTNKVSKTHLIVLQHGFLGTSYDMHLLQNAIAAELPNNIMVMCPHSNDEHSQDSIAQMAKRLAFEVTQFVKEKMPALLQPFTEHRLSFIGHSMGGLIIRLALQETMMKPLLGKLHTYMSLATPHIGTIFADSQLVSTGMWALFKFKKCRSLRELVLEDAIGGKVKKSLLYKMSLNGALSLFSKVLLLSSPKDQYVPTYSARVQVSRRIESDELHGATMTAMATNILSQLRDDQLVRLTLDNNVGDTASVNTLIGRTAHICYLENQAVATQLIATLHPYFA